MISCACARLKVKPRNKRNSCFFIFDKVKLIFIRTLFTNYLLPPFPEDLSPPPPKELELLDELLELGEYDLDGV